MQRFSVGLIALGLFLVLLPATATKPGLPATLKADEPAYYLAAESLVHDGDLRVDAADRVRLFESYPYLPVHNLIVASDDGWHTLFYGKPYLYSFVAAPFVALFGANGLVVLNAALFVAMIAMGAAWLRLHGNPEWLAQLFSVGFFLGSIAWVYVHWLHPEIFNMASGMACLFFGLGALHRDAVTGQSRLGRWLLAPGAMVLSAAALAAGTYNKPMMAALGVPVCLELLRRRRWRDLGVWLAAAALSIGLYAAGSWVLTGHPTAYLVDMRAGFTIHNPYQPPVRPIPKVDTELRDGGAPDADAADGAAADGETADERAASPETEPADAPSAGAGWWWLLRIPDTHPTELAEDLGYFLWGRHTGLFPYQPFALAALVLFAWHGWRRLEGWWVLGSIALVALFFMVFIPFNWHGGGGFVGNRYFVMIYPAFLFLVTRLRPDWIVVPAWAAAGLFIGPLLLSPWGLVVPQGTLQAHVRSASLQALPMDFSLPEIPGYHGVVQHGVWIWARKDQTRMPPPGTQGAIGVRGADTVDIWIQSDRPIEAIDVALRAIATGGETHLRLAGVDHRVDLGDAWTSLSVETEQVHRRRRERRPEAPTEFLDLWIYQLRITSERGELPGWTDRAGPVFPAGVAVRVDRVVQAANPESPATPGP